MVSDVDFNTAKLLGLVGSVMVTISIFLSVISPLVGSLTYLAGLVLVLVSLYFLSEIYRETNIFKYAFLSVVLLIGGFILVAFLLLVVAGVALAQILTSPWVGDFEWVRPRHGATVSIEASAAVLSTFLLALLVLLALILVSAYLWYKAMSILSVKSGEGLFRLSGLLALIASISLVAGFVTVIILVGFLLILAYIPLVIISWVLLAVAFYMLRPPQPPSLPQATQPAFV